MNVPEILYRFIDWTLIPFVRITVPSKDIEHRIHQEQKYWAQEQIEYYRNILSTFHGRASAMVSHLSLMIALCLFLLDTAKNENILKPGKALVVLDTVI